MLLTLRERLTLLLIGLLPFHALLVTAITRFALGPNHAPWSALSVWKEGLLAAIMGLAIVEILRNGKWKIDNGKLWKGDALDALILLLIGLSIVVSILNSPFSISQFLFGFRYDFVPLVAFLLLRRVSWSADFTTRAMKTLLLVGTAVALYALFTLVLPEAFFRFLGYSDLHSLYVPGRPIAAFQLIGETGIRRLQGPMSGPNQLGLWMLLPLGAAFAASLPRKMRGAMFAPVGLTILLTFSRAAWIGAAVLALIAGMPFLRSLSKKVIVGSVCAALAFALVAAALFPSVILRLRSSEGHLRNPIDAMQRMVAAPFGHGLGTAGPASNRVSDACVLLGEDDDPTWAVAHPDLCVFTGKTQVQPVDRACECPFLPENWYLQIGVELGWVGFALYVSLMLLVARRLYELKIENEKLKISGGKLSIINYQLSIFVSLSVTALFLHAFEDAALAYVLWLFAAFGLPVAPKRSNP